MKGSAYGRLDSPACSTTLSLLNQHTTLINLSNLPRFKSSYATYAKHPFTTIMSSSVPQYPVTISSYGRGGTAVSVQWTDWPEVGPRIYPTPGDAASALRWSEDLTIDAIDRTVTLHTLIPINYDTIGKQSIQGEFVSCSEPSHRVPDRFNHSGDRSY